MTEEVLAALGARGPARWTPISGGCIHSAHRIDLADGSRFFVKSNAAPGSGAMFRTEAAALRAIAATGAIRAPEVIAIREAAPAFLVLEFIEPGRRNAGFFEEFGRGLAALHAAGGSAQFGFAEDTFCGSTPQPNAWRGDWIAFFREHRLGHQLRLAERRRFGGELHELGARLMDELDAILAAPAEAPALVHGDLWSGNYLCDTGGRPVLIDPAASFSHREFEFGMTRLFGDMPEAFYRAYAEAHPLAPGHKRRIEVYTLYHLLNHANLFGGGYAGQCVAAMRGILGS